MEKSTIQVEELDESDDFLLELAVIEAEAEAAAKRRKVAAVPEGPYMAALKGSKSEQWQLNPFNPASKSRGGFQGASVNSNPAGSYGSEAGEQDFPEKNCPCGNGVCSILTSNTQKNPGRKFYKCPNREVCVDVNHLCSPPLGVRWNAAENSISHWIGLDTVFFFLLICRK